MTTLNFLRFRLFYIFAAGTAFLKHFSPHSYYDTITGWLYDLGHKEQDIYQTVGKYFSYVKNVMPAPYSPLS
jgi:hypothetical protein